MELLQQFSHAKVIRTDNEPSFTSAQFKSFAQRCGLTLHFAKNLHVRQVVYEKKHGERNELKT